MLLDAGVSIYASSGVTDGSGRYGYVVYVKEEDHRKGGQRSWSGNPSGFLNSTVRALSLVLGLSSYCIGGGSSCLRSEAHCEAIQPGQLHFGSSSPLASSLSALARCEVPHTDRRELPQGLLRDATYVISQKPRSLPRNIVAFFRPPLLSQSYGHGI